MMLLPVPPTAFCVIFVPFGGVLESPRQAGTRHVQDDGRLAQGVLAYAAPDVADEPACIASHSDDKAGDRQFE